METNTRRNKEKIIEKLKEDINSQSQILTQRHFVISLPHKQTHTGHLMGEISGLSRRLDPGTIQKIHQLVAKGVSSTQEMKGSLKRYVEDEVFRNKTCPSFLNRQWFPKRKDIRNGLRQSAYQSMA